MTRKHHTLRFMFQFFGMLTVLTSVAALAQTKGEGQASAKPQPVFALPDANGTGHVSGSHVPKNILGTSPMTPGAPLFVPVVTYDSGGLDASSVAVADVNGDGKPDVIVTNACGNSSNCTPYMHGFEGTVAVLLGNGDGTFQPAVAYDSGGETPVSVAVADVNGDGKPDIIVANKCASGTNCNSYGSVGILLGNGDGTYQAATSYNSAGLYAVSVAVTDFNGDGKLDLAVVHSYGADGICCISPALAVLLGNGDGTFQSAVMYGGGGQTSVAVGDVNGDHRPDLVVANPEGAEILLGNGDGTFQPPVVYDTGSLCPCWVGIADLNGDGKLDLVVNHSVSNGQDSLVSTLLGNGDGTFQGAVTYDPGVQAARSAAVADVNGDGKPDLVVAIFFYSVGVLLGNGDGTFQAATTYGSGGTLALSVVAADVNGDGKPDLVAGNVYGSNSFDGGVGVLLNNTPFPDTTPPVITLAATPRILWPPNGKMVPVTISGTITDTGSGVNASSAAFEVQDTYRRVLPHGKITLDSAGSYSCTVLLQASRKANDLNGRKYIIRVSARDNAGNRGTKAVTITVPHDLH